MRKCEYRGEVHLCIFLQFYMSDRNKICHFKADAYDIKPTSQNPSRVYGLKDGTNNRTFSKIK